MIPPEYVTSPTQPMQEFDSREAAEESVAKYNEGYFMGNKIRVETLSWWR